MTDKHPMEKLVHDSVDYLIRENTDERWGEAIAIIIANMKNKDGLYTMPRLADDYDEHVELCVVLASMLRKYIDSNILNSIPPNIKNKDWVGLTYEDKKEIRESTEPYERETIIRLTEAKLKEKNT